MHKFKNAMAILMVSAFVFAFAGCGKSKETTKKEKKETKSEETEKEETEEEKTSDENTTNDASGFDAAMDAMSQDYPGYLANKLGISADKISETDGSTLTREYAFSGKYYTLSDKDEPMVDCCVFESEKDALNFFKEKYYNPFNEQFKPENSQGESIFALENEHGYIVVNGSGSGAGFFGDRYRSGNEVYAGVYYKGNVLLVIAPRNDVPNTRVEEVIKLLGLPTASGENL